MQKMFDTKNYFAQEHRSTMFGVDIEISSSRAYANDFTSSSVS